MVLMAMAAVDATKENSNKALQVVHELHTTNDDSGGMAHFLAAVACSFLRLTLRYWMFAVLCIVFIR